MRSGTLEVRKQLSWVEAGTTVGPSLQSQHQQWRRSEQQDRVQGGDIYNRHVRGAWHGADACASTVSVRVMHAIACCTPSTLTGTHKIEAVEPHTIAIITEIFGGALYRPMRQTFSPKLSRTNDFAAAIAVCRWRLQGRLMSRCTTTRSHSTTILLLSCSLFL